MKAETSLPTFARAGAGYPERFRREIAQGRAEGVAASGGGATHDRRPPT